MHTIKAGTELWRISNYRSLDGIGAVQQAARWNTAGRPLVYLAESAPGALVEIMAHLDVDEDELPSTYQLLRIETRMNFALPVLADAAGEVYREDVEASQRLGDLWIASASSALARVPSAVLPHTWNVLLNPKHPLAQSIRIKSATKASFDPRLLRHVLGK